MPMLTVEIEGTDEQCEKFRLAWERGTRQRIDGMKIQCVSVRPYNIERLSDLSKRVVNGDMEAAVLYLRELNGIDTREQGTV